MKSNEKQSTLGVGGSRHQNACVHLSVEVRPPGSSVSSITAGNVSGRFCVIPGRKSSQENKVKH